MWRLLLNLTGFVELLCGHCLMAHLNLSKERYPLFMETLTFKIQEDNFEGPLDLLLYLVGKNKMNLYDINIMELIEQYTAAIREMQQDRMEVSSEFIDMAAHLVQMKSALLLPRSPEAERMKAGADRPSDRVQRLQGGGRPAGQPCAGFVHRSARADAAGGRSRVYPPP